MSEEGTKTLLTLGDGNFTFSLSLQDALIKYDVKNQIIATSYDSHDDILIKYPDAGRVLSQLSARATKHAINATDSFQYIIFNFPHLGVEDCTLHSYFLAHVFANVYEVLSNTGLCYISLAQGQPDRWNMLSMAARNGFTLHSSFAFAATDWPGYVLRRHQTGKSFQARVEDLYCYAFRKSSCTAEKVKNLLFDIITLHRKDNTLVQSTAPETSQPMKQKRKKRKVDACVQDSYVRTTALSDGIESVVYECKECGKHFKLEQGVKTHVYMTHVLHVAGKEDTTLQCAICDDNKVYANQDALHQHQLAKHSDISTARPHKESQADAVMLCEICGAVIGSLEEHMKSFEPIVLPSFECSCGKVLGSERALIQHRLFCGTSSKSNDSSEIEAAAERSEA